MGGRKKLSIKQMEKRQKLKQLKEERKRREEQRQREKIETVLLIDKGTLENIRKELIRSKCITPASLALKYNIKISTAKKILRQLEEEGTIIPVNKSRRITIYVGANAKVEIPKPVISL